MQASPPPEPASQGRLGSLILSLILLAVALGLGLSKASSPKERAALAALDGYRVLGQATLGQPEQSLASVALQGPELTRLDPGNARFALGRVRLLDPEGVELEADAAALRRSIARGLRSAAEAGIPRADGDLPKDLNLELEGELEPAPGGADFSLSVDPAGLTLVLDSAGQPPQSAKLPWSAPNRRSILPPLVAIALAIATRRPLVSLFCGVALGAMLVRLGSGDGLPLAAGAGVVDVFSHYIWGKVSDLDKLQIVVFVILMLAMVGNLTRNGGIQGLMGRLSKLAKNARSAQITTYLMGLAVFFDDYANTVLVGSTMRPLTDKFKVAREKLAYLVDSTAAPVAGLSVFSTWIAFEVSTFASQLPAAGLKSTDGYAVFLETLPYRFYCWFTLALVALIVVTGRDFGPMRHAEHRARTYGQLLRPGSTPMVSSGGTSMEMAPGVIPKARSALLPLAAFIGVTLFEIARRGGAFSVEPSTLLTLRGISQVLKDGSGNGPLMIGSLCGFLLAILTSLSAGLSFLHISHAAWQTLRSMGIALGILYLAWAIGDVCSDLGTAPYLALQISGFLDPVYLPVALFVLSGLIAFSTGSSWGTMSILLPLVVGLAFQMGHATPVGSLGLVVISIGAVLEGSIFGDHCSPISDTTVLSSIASASDHLDHVRTQMPYALTAMATAIGLGYLPSVLLGWSPFIGLGLGLAVLVAVVFLVGRPAAAPDPVVDGQNQP